MYLQDQLKEIGQYYHALKADVKIAEPEGPERQKRISDLEEHEINAKASATKDYEELQAILKDAKLLAESLEVSVTEALQLISYRETKRIHFHIDQLIER